MVEETRGNIFSIRELLYNLNELGNGNFAAKTQEDRQYLSDSIENISLF